MSKPSSRGTPWALAAQAVHDVAQLAVVHVHHALPRDLAHVDAQLVSVVDVRVQQGRQQVVGRADGVEVAREVQVDVLHGDDLGVPAAGRTAPEAEHGAERRLAQRHDHVLALLRQRVGQAHRRGSLALTGRRGVDGGDQDELARLVLHVLEQVVVHLRLVGAVHLQVRFRHARLLGDGADRLRLRCLGNFDVAQHVGPSLFLVGALSCILLVFRPVTTLFSARVIKYQQPGARAARPQLKIGRGGGCRSRYARRTAPAHLERRANLSAPQHVPKGACPLLGHFHALSLGGSITKEPTGRGRSLGTSTSE